MATNGITNGTVPEDINNAADRVKFAYWVPNVSGGLVISKIPQDTKWDFESNVRYAQKAEDVGFEFALSQIRFMAGYGAVSCLALSDRNKLTSSQEFQHEPVSLSQAILHQTKKINLIAALLPGPWNPAVAAKMIASIDHYTKGYVQLSSWSETLLTRPVESPSMSCPGGSRPSSLRSVSGGWTTASDTEDPESSSSV